MTDPRVRYVAYDLATGEALGEVPLTTLGYDKVLNGPGGWRTGIAHNHPAVSGDNRTRLEVNRSAVWVLAGSAPPLFAGIVRAPSASIGPEDQGDSLQVGGDGIWGYFRGDGSSSGRFWRLADTEISGTVYDAVDLLLVAAQAYAGGDIGLEVETHGTAPTIEPFVLTAAEAPNIGNVIERLCADYGVEFDTDYRWDEDVEPWVPIPVLSLHYPRRGRDTSVVFEHGGNVDVLRYDIDGLHQGNTGIILGAGDGTDQVRTTVADPSVISPDGAYPLLEFVAVDKDITTLDRLVTFGNVELARRRRPAKTAGVQVRADADNLDLRALITGDSVLLAIDEGYVVEDGSRWRIDGIGVSFDAEGIATVSYNLVLAELLEYGPALGDIEDA